MTLLVRDSKIIQDATSGKRVTPGWLAYVVVIFGFILIGQSITLNLLGLLWPTETGSVQNEIIQALAFAGPLVLLFMWLKFYEKRAIPTLGFHKPDKGIISLLIGIAIGIALVSIPIIFIWLVGAYESAPSPADSISGWLIVPILLVVVIFIVLQSGTEETIARGFLLQNSGLKLPGWIAVVLPALVFTALHGAYSNLLPYASIFLFALMASFVVLRAGTLWLMIGIHAGWNFAVGNIYGIPSGGLPPNNVSLLFLRPVQGAPEWLTGGTYGTGASLPAVITVLVAAIVTFIQFRSASRTSKFQG